ncbi:MAG: hypothetical protein JNG88_12885, partial [Phycisphaerales bacterium]|nr:hypothetical protein [Phycisphaerales bacterium]
MAILLTCCCAHFASIALSDAGPRELTLLWQRELPNDIEWLALRETDVGPFLLVQTREPRLVLMDALHSGFYAPLVYEPDPGSRLIECSCRSGVPFVVAGRHAVYGVWPRVDRGAEPLDWERRVRVGGFSTGEQFNPARDVPGDPEILRGMVAAGQSDQGILIAGKSRDVVRLDEVNASEQGGFLAAGDVQRIAPGTDGWALLTRERGRYGVTLVETTAQRREMSLYSCDLDDVGPQWFGLVGKSAVCVSPAAVDIIQPFGLWVRFAPDQGRFFIHSTTCVLEGSTGRPLVLVGDS